MFGLFFFSFTNEMKIIQKNLFKVGFSATFSVVVTAIYNWRRLRGQSVEVWRQARNAVTARCPSLSLDFAVFASTTGPTL